MIPAPKYWTSRTIGEVTLPVDKHRPEEEPLREFQYVDISSIDNDRNVIAEPKTLLGKDAPSRARQVLRTGDTVLSTVRTYLKNTAMVPTHLDGATASTGFSVLRPDRDQIEPRFLYYRVLEEGFVGELSEKQTGTSYPAVRDSDVRSMAVSCPELDEQQRIVEMIEEQFSRIEAGVESLQRGKLSLERLRRSVTMSMFQSDWPLVALGDVAEISGGITKNRRLEADPNAVEVPYLRVANVQRGYLDLSEVKTIRAPREKVEKTLLRDGDVLFTEGGDRDKLGRGWVWRDELERCAHQNHVFRARIDQTEFVPEFVSIYSNHFGRGWFEEMGKQTTNLASISLSTLREFPIPSPPLAVQEGSMVEIDRIDSIVDNVEAALESNLDRANGLRRSMLIAAFSGRLVSAHRGAG